MKKLYTVVLILIAWISNSQIIFEKGYFIDNAGARTECFIRNVDWRYNPVGFEYKLAADDASVNNETMDKVQEFGIENGSKYKRFIVQIERSQTDANKLSKIKSPDFKAETLFLKEIVSGNANLYIYKDGPFVKFFYDTKVHPIEQLIFIRYLNKQGDAAENNQFWQQLLNHVKNENVSETDIKKTKYSQLALTTYFEKFNNESKLKAQLPERKKRDNPYHLSVVVGATVAHFEIVGPLYTTTEIKNQMLFRAGFEAEYILPFNKNTWSIFISPGYQKFESDGTFTRHQIFDEQTTSPVSVSYRAIELPIGLRYYLYLNTASKLYFDAACVLDFASNSTVIIDNLKILNLKSNSGLGFGVGYNYKSFGCAIRVSTPRNTMTNYAAWRSKYSTTGLLVTYKIF